MTSQDGARGTVIPQRRGGQQGEAVRAGVLHDMRSESSADAHAL